MIYTKVSKCVEECLMSFRQSGLDQNGRTKEQNSRSVAVTLSFTCYAIIRQLNTILSLQVGYIASRC